MIREFKAGQPHSDWLELCALATTGELQPAEREKLASHLATCSRCREALSEFHAVAKEVGPLFIENLGSVEDDEIEFREWDADKAKRSLFAKLDVPEQIPSLDDLELNKLAPARKSIPIAFWLGLVATLIIAVGFSCYRLGLHQGSEIHSEPPVLQTKVSALSAEKGKMSEQLIRENERIASLARQTSQYKNEIEDLRERITTGDTRTKDVRSEMEEVNQRFHATQAERDDFAVRWQSAQQAYESAQAELTSLRTQRQQDLLHYASLEVEITDLNKRLRDTETRVSSDTQYLASDRDIRELMGARQLYIADVVDVDQNGDRRKPFGRVFYTKGKSLIFYAFDLDRQPAKESATFQAWAREGTDNAKPISLGILYVDSEANRRWVLKAEDPKALAQINAVFVTVEPKGGSRKPTSKPFLYAYLHSASPNHP